MIVNDRPFEFKIVPAAIKGFKRQAALQAALARASGIDPLARIRDSLNGKPLFCEDGLAYQHRMRDEWPE